VTRDEASPLVVVVEDDPATLRALGRVLRAGGFETATYSSAEAFLDSPPTREPSCLLLDNHLGGMSGLDLQRDLRSRGSRVPVIVMTAFNDRRVRNEAYRIGCAGCVDKADDFDVLLKLLRSVG
jgi:FixJ family two-component response regulator